MRSKRKSDFWRRWQSRIFTLRSPFAGLALALALSACAHTPAASVDEEPGTIIEKGPSLGSEEGVAAEEISVPTETAPIDQAAPENVKKNCVVLGPGMALALAQVGALQALQEAERPMDCLAGIEMGAVVAALFADKSNINHVKWELFKLKADNYFERGLLSFAFRKSSGKKLHELFEQWFGNRSFAELRMPVAVSAVDQKGELHIFPKETKIADALSASVALPGIFEPWNVAPWGPMQSPTDKVVFAVDAAQAMGSAHPLILDVLGPALTAEARNKQEEAILNSFRSMQKLATLQLEGETNKLRIALPNAAPWELQRQEEFFQAGLEAARAQLPAAKNAANAEAPADE